MLLYFVAIHFIHKKITRNRSKGYRVVPSVVVWLGNWSTIVAVLWAIGLGSSELSVVCVELVFALICCNTRIRTLIHNHTDLAGNF